MFDTLTARVKFMFASNLNFYFSIITFSLNKHSCWHLNMKIPFSKTILKLKSSNLWNYNYVRGYPRCAPLQDIYKYCNTHYVCKLTLGYGTLKLLISSGQKRTWWPKKCLMESPSLAFEEIHPNSSSSTNLNTQIFIKYQDFIHCFNFVNINNSLNITLHTHLH